MDLQEGRGHNTMFAFRTVTSPEWQGEGVLGVEVNSEQVETISRPASSPSIYNGSKLDIGHQNTHSR